VKNSLDNIFEYVLSLVSRIKVNAMKKFFLIYILGMLIFLTACGRTYVTDDRGRKEIVVATLVNHITLSSQVAVFNSENEDYFITIEEYLTYDGG